MRKMVLTALMVVGIMSSASAQRDDLYFVPKKKKVVTTQVEEKLVVDELDAMSKTYAVTSMPAKQLEMDEDAYNRRGSYLTVEDDAMLQDAESKELTRVDDSEGWVNGFEGSDSDYEYAMRIIRFRNPRYAIPVSSPLYWDVVYGGALWSSWEWNVYDDGMYAYVVPTSSNWYYWDYYMNYPLGWSAWGNHWYAHHGYHWGLHWGNHYYGWQFCGHMAHAPWYNPGWHHGHYPGVSRPGWGGGGHKVIQNNRTPGSLPSHRGTQVGSTPSRVGSSARVVAGHTGGTGTSVSRPSGTAVRSSSSSHTSSNEVVRRSTGSSSVNRSSSSSSSGSGYTSRSSSGSSSTSYSRPSSTRSSSSSTSRSSSSSSSTSSRSSSYSSGSSSRSSYSSGSSYGGSSSRSSGSYGGSSSRSSGARR